MIKCKRLINNLGLFLSTDTEIKMADDKVQLVTRDGYIAGEEQPPTYTPVAPQQQVISGDHLTLTLNNP